MKKVFHRILTFLLIITSPIVLLSGMVVFSCAMSFHVSFAIENGTDQVIMVTPVGTWGRNNLAVLPQFDSRVYFFPPPKNRDYILRPGEKKTILYDWDDINFSHIYIRTAGGIEKQMVVNPKPVVYSEKYGGFLYFPPEKDVYVIENIDSLPGADAELSGVVKRKEGLDLYWILIFYPPLWLILLIMEIRVKVIEYVRGKSESP